MRRCGYNQAQLAKEAGITPPALCKILKKERTPSSDVLVKIATALEVSLDYLVGKSNKVEFSDLIQNQDIQLFYKNFSELSHSDKEQVSMMIEILKSRKKAK